MVIWITGLPGSGKSALSQALLKMRPEVQLVSMDAMRKVVTPDPTYSEEERQTAYRALVYTAMRLAQAGFHVVIDATAHKRQWRDLARTLIPHFMEVHLLCPETTCRQREAARSAAHNTHGAPEGVYKKATEGWPVPGAGVKYEAPLAPELALDTSKMSPEQEADSVLRAAGI